jgi:plasmid stability protein
MKHERMTQQILVPVPPQLRARIEARAAAEDRSLAYEARQLLERGLQQSEEAAA